MVNDSVAQLAAATARSYLEAPAGYGKTETIAEATACCDGKQLILTHTHAGVDSIRKRLKSKGVKPNAYRLETISAWCLRLVAAYPVSSKCSASDDPEWSNIYGGVEELLKLSGIKQIVSASYSGVIVDEYQDCTEAQHRVIELLSGLLPVRIVGDPLQGIFGFRGEVLVNWDTLIYPQYNPLPPLMTAWRWEGHNVALGNWLADSRNRLKANQSPDYTTSAATYLKVGDEEARRKAIHNVKVADGETLVVLVKFPNEAHSFAQKFPGFTSMEEIECKELIKACKEWKSKSGCALMVSVIQFVQQCCTAPDQDLKTVLRRLAEDKLEGIGKLVPKELTEKLEAFGSGMTISDAMDLCFVLSKLKGRRMYRSELFYAMIQTLRLHARKPDLDFVEAARQVRDRVSHGGRKQVVRLVSRVLLVKGLEYDHVIVLDPSNLSNCELYVALTRARKSLTVIEGPPRKKAKTGTASLSVSAAARGSNLEPAGQQSLFAEIDGE